MASDPADLCAVVKEIIDALLDTDWARYRSDNGDQYYYVIRQRHYEAEIAGGRAYSHTLAFRRHEGETFWDWYIRAALAEEPADRLAAARKRVAAAGVDPKVFDEAMQAFITAESVDELSAVLERWAGRFLRHERFDAFTALMEAIRIERLRHGHIFLSATDRPELLRAVEVRFLKELGERYPKAVRRATTFDWLSFNDPQLREASRCYIYGFFRAAVLIAVAAFRGTPAEGVRRRQKYDLPHPRRSSIRGSGCLRH